MPARDVIDVRAGQMRVFSASSHPAAKAGENSGAGALRAGDRTDSCSGALLALVDHELDASPSNDGSRVLAG